MKTYTFLVFCEVQNPHLLRLSVSNMYQTWKMSEIFPEQDCSFPDFTQKCMNYVNFRIATKQRTLNANTTSTTFTSLHPVCLKIQNWTPIGAWLR